MMAADIARLGYRVILVTEKGERHDLTGAVTSLTWEEQEGQLAMKATVGVAADATAGGKPARSILKLNRLIRVLGGGWGEGRNVPLFEGAIWDWGYQHGTQKSLSVTAYDPMIRLQQSKEHKYFSAGMDTKEILGSICRDAGVPLAYKWGQSIRHEKKAFKAATVSDMATELLDEVREQTGVPYVALYRDGKMEVCGYGGNADVYRFGPGSTVSATDKLSMGNLVTRVKVLGKADDEGRSRVEAVVDGDLGFGVLQEIVARDSDKSLGKAKAEARAILAERGKPEESVMATAPDLPFLRKGDAVEMAAGSLSGTFHVLGVSHNAASRQMTMTLRRKQET